MDAFLKLLCEQIIEAAQAGVPVAIRGGGTKDFYGERPGEAVRAASIPLDMRPCAGILSYEPSELVITARAGTLLAEVEEALAGRGQMLAFEPPRLGPGSTLGGCVAAGLSGPRRMAAGPLRDFVLGAKLLGAGGAPLSFGGQVMKNVAGYDVSRLLAGSMGIFGPLLEVSLKVVPRPVHEATRLLHVDEAGALALFGAWRRQPLPVSAAAWEAGTDGGRLWIRLSGSMPAIAAAAAMGGDEVDPARAAAFWSDLRDQRHGFFASRPLWRLAVPPSTPPLNLGPTLIEWGGGLRWVQATAQRASELRQAVQEKGGHATLYRCDEAGDTPVFHPLPEPLLAVSRRLKKGLDPAGIFNPHRLFREF